MKYDLIIALNLKPRAIEIVSLSIKTKYQAEVNSNKKCWAIKELSQDMLGYAYLNSQFKVLLSLE